MGVEEQYLVSSGMASTLALLQSRGLLLLFYLFSLFYEI